MKKEEITNAPVSPITLLGFDSMLRQTRSLVRFAHPNSSKSIVAQGAGIDSACNYTSTGNVSTVLGFPMTTWFSGISVWSGVLNNGKRLVTITRSFVSLHPAHVLTYEE